MGIFTKKTFGCKGGLCPLKEHCKKYTNYLKDRYTTSYAEIPYNHIKQECKSYEPYKQQ